MNGMEGGCFCGEVRYRLTEAPMFTHCCHCRECQSRTGSAFVINMLIETDRIELVSGQPAPMRVPSSSGRPHDIYRCTACETALWSDYGERAWLRFVRAGTLDDPASIAPDAHIYTRTKLPWVQLPEGTLSVEEYYDMPAIWPSDSWARREQASASATSTL